jgi:hypothetical protein
MSELQNQKTVAAPVTDKEGGNLSLKSMPKKDSEGRDE